MTVTVTPTVQASNIPPRIQLAITTTTETATTIVRNNPDGSQSIVRTSDGGPLPVSGGTATLYDYEAPFSSTGVTYSSYESPGTVSARVVIDPGVPWLIHPGVPSLSQTIAFREGSLQEEVQTIRQGLFPVMGRPNPVPITDGVRKGSTSSITLYTQTAADYQNLKAILAPGVVLLLNIPTSFNTLFDPAYIAVGDVKLSRWTSAVIDANRDIQLPFTVVDAPSGGTQAQRTYVDLLNYATYGALRNAYSSYAALLAGP